MLATEKEKKYFDAKKSKVDASLRFHEIFHCFMVLCLDFEDVNSFFMGISRRAYYYMHQFFQARFYCFESLQVCLGWEKRRVNDVAKTQKNWNIFSTSREYCILLICWSLTSWLHFLNKASTNTIERSTTWDIWTSFCLYISILFIRIPALLLRPLWITIQSKLSNNELVNMALPNQRQSFHSHFVHSNWF